MFRRFFESFEERVESGVGDLVRLVENVNLEAVASGPITGPLAEFADFVDAAVGGRVDFDYIDGVTGANFSTGFADAARLRNRSVFRTAVQRHGQNSGDRRLADAAVAAKDVA